MPVSSCVMSHCVMSQGACYPSATASTGSMATQCVTQSVVCFCRVCTWRSLHVRFMQHSRRPSVLQSGKKNERSKAVTFKRTNIFHLAHVSPALLFFTRKHGKNTTAHTYDSSTCVTLNRRRGARGIMEQTDAFGRDGGSRG